MADDQQEPDAESTGESGSDGESGQHPDRAAVRDTYDRIATHFASTREYAWPEVEEFVETHARSPTLQDGAEDGTDERERGLGLDLGCGNCRHAELLAAAGLERVVGLDVSRGLLETGRKRAQERSFTGALDLCQGDASRLPLAADGVDLAVYVATLHHLPTADARQASLDELARVLDPDGRALVSAWSTAHDRFDEADETDEHGFDTTVEWTLPGGEPVDRFYHIYAPAEFERELECSDLAVLEWEISSGNCYATVAGSGSGRSRSDSE
ncbi:class I SAM-dependent methyltransferase [Halobiforma nitratireducens]|uniref:Type 11 methyltransferase n=1 Tax=Halobiforma nitratireducens JCM 10879 TaxID=1227454 RepID=M0M392_9EURY|nr:class I SAM-dependent methyltransferase [Halobiforma nitratireducens]EMA39878.1 type 11 methyltransferase [Halobiforma nitratireducens JCM 10879]